MAKSAKASAVVKTAPSNAAFLIRQRFFATVSTCLLPVEGVWVDISPLGCINAELPYREQVIGPTQVEERLTKDESLSSLSPLVSLSKSH